MSAGLGILELCQKAARRKEEAALNHPRMTAPQRAYASSTARRLLWRGGNSIGKSWIHAWDDIHFTRGTHPFRPCPKGPRSVLIAGYSFAQMDPLLQKLWALLPKDEIDPRLYYQPGNGILGFKVPCIPFVAGPGRGSVIYLATYEQGPERIMGWQGHRLSLDEPPPQDVYAEAIPRLNFFAGELRVTFTPTTSSPPLDYIREEVAEGRITELQTDYEEANCTILGGPVAWAWKTQAEIDADVAGYLPDDREMRRSGAWTPAIKGRALELIGEHCWIDGPIPKWKEFRIGVGIDHGTRPGRQSASLVTEAGGDYYILDEYRPQKAASTEEDARGILAMLARWRIPYTRVNLWIGDRATSASYWGEAKSNQDLLEALAAELRITAKEARRTGLKIQTARKPRGSVRRGVAKLNSLAREGRLKVHSRAAGFRAAALAWKGDDASELKDSVDSARYALMALYDKKELDNPTFSTIGA